MPAPRCLRHPGGSAVRPVGVCAVLVLWIVFHGGGGGTAWGVPDPDIQISPTDFTFALQSGQSSTQNLVVQNTAGGGPDLTYSLVTSVTDGGEVKIDTLGDDVLTATGTNRYRGNMYQITKPARLRLAESHMNLPAGTQTLHFVVFESTTWNGTFTLIYEQTISRTGGGTAFYASDPMNLDLDVGKFYVVMMGWTGVDFGYSYEERVGGPSVSFGFRYGGFGVDSYPINSTITSGYSGSNAYYQRLTTDKTWLSVEADEGTLPAGASETIVVTANAAGLAGGTYLGSIVATSNDPDEATSSALVTLFVTPLPTSTPTRTRTSTRTATPSPSSSATATPSITETPSVTVTATDSVTDTPTSTSTPTDIDTVTQTPSITETPTPTDSITPTPSETSTHTGTPTESSSPTRTGTSTGTFTPTRTATPTDTDTQTPPITETPTSTDSITPTPSETSTHTGTPTKSSSPTRTGTSTGTFTPTRTGTPTPTPTDTVTPAPPTSTPTGTSTQTVTATTTRTSTPPATATPSDTRTATQTASPSRTLTRTRTSTMTPSRTETETQVGGPTTTDTPTATATASNEPTATASHSPTLTETPSVTSTSAPSKSETPTTTLSPVPTVSPSPTPSETSSATATPTVTVIGTPQLIEVVPDESIPIGLGTAIFEFSFSHRMDTSRDPIVTFGTLPPYNIGLAFIASPGWIDDFTWHGGVEFTNLVSDGLYTLGVSGARTEGGITIPRDTTHHFLFLKQSPNELTEGHVTDTATNALGMEWERSDRPDVSGHIIGSAPQAEGPYEVVDAAGSLESDFVHFGLNSDTPYFYRIYEVFLNKGNGTEVRQLTNTFDGRTLAKLANGHAEGVSQTQMRITWESEDNPGAVGYQVRRAERREFLGDCGENPGTIVADILPSERVAIDRDLRSDRVYYYDICVLDSEGNAARLENTFAGRTLSMDSTLDGRVDTMDLLLILDAARKDENSLDVLIEFALNWKTQMD